MPKMIRKAGRYQAIPLTFTQDDVAASQSAVAMNTHAVAGAELTTTEYLMPFPGWVVGISARHTAARTGGSCTADATIDGTATGLQAVLDATNTQSHYSIQETELDHFTANQRIGVKITTDAPWAPTNEDLIVVVWCLVDILGAV